MGALIFVREDKGLAKKVTRAVTAEQLVLSMEVEEQAELEAGQLRLFEMEPEREVSSTLAHLFREAKNTPPPSVLEEKKLGERILAGDIEAQHELIRRNIRLAIWMAKKYGYYSVPLEELIQAGMLAMVVAVAKFDYRVTKFSNYMYKRIKTRLEQLVASAGLVLSCPLQWVAVCRHIHAVNSALTRLNRRPATAEEVLASLGTWIAYKVTAKQVAEVLAHRAVIDGFLSLDDEVRGAGDETVARRDLRPQGAFASPLTLVAGLEELDRRCAFVNSVICAIPRGRYHRHGVRVFTLHYGINSSGVRRTYDEMATLPGFPNQPQSLSKTVQGLWTKIGPATGLNQKALKEVLERIAYLAEACGVERNTLFKDYDIEEVVVFCFVFTLLVASPMCNKAA